MVQPTRHRAPLHSHAASPGTASSSFPEGRRHDHSTEVQRQPQSYEAGPDMTVTADEVTDAGAGQVDWLHIAREMADDLATDAVEREQAGKAPLDEVSRLRESGLLTLLAPAEQGEEERTGARSTRSSGPSPRPTVPSATCWATTTSCPSAPASSPALHVPPVSSGSRRRGSGAGEAVSPHTNRRSS